MVIYKLFFTKTAKKDLKKLDKKIRSLIQAKLLILSTNPNLLINNIKKLTGVSAFRLRVGNYRIVFEKDDEILTILIIKIKPRGEVYKNGYTYN